MPLYLEDFSEGQCFSSRDYFVTTEEIKAFASLYDPQPFHLDEEQAGQSFFGGLAASGWHTAAITMRLLVETVDVEGGLVGAGIEKLRWLKPVRPGDSLRLECEVLSIRKSSSRPKLGLVRVKHLVFTQADLVQEFISTIVVPSYSTEITDK